MTKLMEWIAGLVTFLAIYVALLQNQMQYSWLDVNRFYVQISPIFFVGAFGLYSVWTILYRVFTFNDCTEAAAEIQRQILEAKADLTAKGFRFDREEPQSAVES